MASIRSPEVGAPLLTNSGDCVALIDVDASRADYRSGPGFISEPESGFANAPE